MVTNYSTNTQQNLASDVAMESRLRIIVWFKWCEKTSRITCSLKVHIAQCVRNACAMRAQYSDFAQCTHVSGPDDRKIRSPDDRGKRDVWGFVSEICDIL